MNINKERRPIYQKHYLSDIEIDRIANLMESAYQAEKIKYGPEREHIWKDKIKFAATQHANRIRISNIMKVSPLNEDAKIFGNIPNVKQLFENTSNFSSPSNIVGLGDFRNPASSSGMAGGINNPDYKAGSGDMPTYLFGLQSNTALHTIAFDLIPTIAVETPKVTIQFVDTIYGGGTLGDNENLPTYIDIAAPELIKSFLDTKNLERSVTELWLVATTTKKALKVLYVLSSTIKAEIQVKVLATGTYDDTTPIDSVWNNAFSVQEVIDAINSDTALIKGKIYFNGADDATGKNISKVAAKYTSAIRDNISEAATNNNSRFGMTRSQHEKGVVNKLNVQMMEKQLEMIGFEIQADTSNIQIRDMAASNINVLSELYIGVENQLIQSIDEFVLEHLYRLGVTHAVNAYESQGINMSLYISSPSNTSIAMTSINCEFKDILGNDVKSRMGTIKNDIINSNNENQNTHGNRLFQRILAISEFAGQQNRISALDFVVASGEICACLKMQSNYIICPVTNTLSSNPELHYSGSVMGISVYKNPKISFRDPRILFGRRGNDSDPGAKFLAYDLAASRQTIAEGTMAEKITVWSRFNIADVGFYPELNYYTAIAKNDSGWV